MAKLLPPNTTTLERNFSENAEQSTQLPVRINSLADIDNAPENFLSFLAWQYGVDRWDPAWTPDVKRKLIKSSFNTHKIKGTIASLRKIASAWGYSINVVEWWQTIPEGIPGTFSLDLITNGNVLTGSIYRVLMELLQEAIPLTRHLTAIELKVPTLSISMATAAGCYDSDQTILYPFVEDLTGQLNGLAVLYDFEETFIYPSTP